MSKPTNIIMSKVNVPFGGATFNCLQMSRYPDNYAFSSCSSVSDVILAIIRASTNKTELVASAAHVCYRGHTTFVFVFVFVCIFVCVRVWHAGNQQLSLRFVFLVVTKTFLFLHILIEDLIFSFTNSPTLDSTI